MTSYWVNMWKNVLAKKFYLIISVKTLMFLSLSKPQQYMENYTERALVGGAGQPLFHVSEKGQPPADKSAGGFGGGENVLCSRSRKSTGIWPAIEVMKVWGLVELQGGLCRTVCDWDSL